MSLVHAVAAMFKLGFSSYNEDVHGQNHQNWTVSKGNK